MAINLDELLDAESVTTFLAGKPVTTVLAGMLGFTCDLLDMEEEIGYADESVLGGLRGVVDALCAAIIATTGDDI